MGGPVSLYIKKNTDIDRRERDGNGVHYFIGG